MFKVSLWCHLRINSTLALLIRNHLDRNLGNLSWKIESLVDSYITSRTVFQGWNGSMYPSKLISKYNVHDSESSNISMSQVKLVNLNSPLVTSSFTSDRDIRNAGLHPRLKRRWSGIRIHRVVQLLTRKSETSVELYLMRKSCIRLWESAQITRQRHWNC